MDDISIGLLADIKEQIGESRGQIGIILKSHDEIFSRLNTLTVNQQKNRDELQEVKRIVTNGLTKKMDELCEDFSSFKIDQAAGDAKKVAVLSDDLNSLKEDQIKEYEANWLSRLMTKGVKKIIIGVFIIVIVNALVSGALWSIIKTVGFKKFPYQQQSVLNRINGLYHQHTFSDGTKISHSGNPSDPAFCYDPATKKWTPAPYYRVEESVPK